WSGDAVRSGHHAGAARSLIVPNLLGVDYCAHTIETILKHVAPGLG
ncbi:hypothetical protein ACZ87_02472, partial [Candidatus Erwinia dacicola]